MMPRVQGVLGAGRARDVGGSAPSCLCSAARWNQLRHRFAMIGMFWLFAFFARQIAGFDPSLERPRFFTNASMSSFVQTLCANAHRNLINIIVFTAAPSCPGDESTAKEGVQFQNPPGKFQMALVLLKSTPWNSNVDFDCNPTFKLKL